MLQYENYVKTEWTNGDLISDELLNKIETGIKNLDSYITSAEGIVDTFTTNIQEINDKIGNTSIGEDVTITSIIANMQINIDLNTNKIDEIDGIITSVLENDATFSSAIDELYTLQEENSNLVITKTASGNIVSFSDGGDNIPVKDLIIDINPVQDLHGYANPWPAGGGKNLLPCTLENGSQNGITWTVGSDGVIVVSGSSSSGVVEKEIGRVTLESGSYKMNGGTYPTNDLRMQLKLASGGSVIASSYNNNDAAFSVSETGEYVVTMVAAPITISGTETIKPMIRFASVTDATFAPYSNICPITGWTGMNVVVSPTTTASDGTTYPISWQSTAGTVYGGTLDVTTGVLTVDRVIDSYNGSQSENWYETAGYVNRFGLNNAATYSPSGNYQNFIANYLVSTAWGAAKYTFGLRTDGALFLMLDNSATQMTLDEFKAYLTANPLSICYELATPVTYQLTPNEVKTLLGNNVIWADCGPTVVEYRADSGLFIANETTAIRSCIAPTENGATASQAYAQGKYFFRGGNFCKAKTAIASGASFTLNTNYEITTVAAELYALQ